MVSFPAISQNSIWCIVGNLVFVEGRERMTKAEGEGGGDEADEDSAEGRRKQGKKEFYRQVIFF